MNNAYILDLFGGISKGELRCFVLLLKVLIAGSKFCEFLIERE